MENMNDLNDLLKHEIMDLYSAEEQIIEAMPAMIAKAKDPELKKALKEHLRITEQQRKRLDQVQKLLGQEGHSSDDGLFGRLFKNRHTCRGMEGIIEEGEKIMKEDMDNEVMDAAILASSQKVEHYEICGYGTARSYAIQLGHNEVARLLSETLDEEYEADRLLTDMAERRINIEAEFETSHSGTGSSQSRSGSRSGSRSKVQEPEMEMASSGRTGSSSSRSGSSGSAPKGTGSRSNASSGRSSTSSASRKTSASKSESKTSGSRSGSNGRGSSSSRGSSRTK